jgi:hypothetical protein
MNHLYTTGPGGERNALQPTDASPLDATRAQAISHPRRSVRLERGRSTRHDAPARIDARRQSAKWPFALDGIGRATGAGMPEPRATRVSRRAFPALSTLAAVFILPTYRACSTDVSYSSPAHFASESVASAVWIAPIFLVALALAVLSVKALASGEVDRTTRRLGLAALGALVASMFVGVAMELSQVLFAVPALLVGGAMLRHARGRPAWEIWEHLLAVYAILTVGTFPSVVLISDAFTSRDNLGPGAYVYLAALVALLAVTLTPRLAALRRSA